MFYLLNNCPEVNESDLEEESEEDEAEELF